ncbi:hypothetical protein [Agromyces sp. NPDC057865]|uniref:hypothetical protein n=1 Tax=Agromyces sp. NPDC057865 TaxID=3346267 RepID=UPI003671D7EC
MTTTREAALPSAERRLDRRRLHRALPRPVAVLVPAVLALVLAGIRSLQLPFWRDEFATSMYASLRFGDLLSAVEHVDGVLAPYYVLAHALMPVLGPDVGLRIPSLLAFAGSAAVVSLVALRWWGSWAGLAAGIALATNGAAVTAAASARPYALAVLFVAFAVLAADAAAAGGRRRTWIGYALAACAAVAAHVLAAIAIALTALLLIGRYRSSARAWMVASVPAGLITIGLLLLGSGHRGQLAWLGTPDLRSALAELARAVGLTLDVAVLLDGVALITLALAAAAALRAAITAPDAASADAGTVGRASRVRPVLFSAALAVAPWALLFVASLTVTPILATRYLLWSALGSALVIAAAVAAALTARRSIAIVAGVAAIGLLAVSASAAAVRVVAPPPRGDDFPALVADLASRAEPGDLVLVAQPYEQGGVAWGFATSAGDPRHRAELIDRLPDGTQPTLEVRRITSVAPLRTTSDAAATIGDENVWTVTIHDLTDAQLAQVDPALATCVADLDDRDAGHYGAVRLLRTSCRPAP